MKASMGMRFAVLRQRSLHRRLEGPVIAFVLDLDARFIGKVRTLVDPRTEDTDLFGREVDRPSSACAFGTESGDEVDQGRGGTVALHERRAEFTSGEEGRFVIEPEIRLLMFRTVAVVAGSGRRWAARPSRSRSCGSPRRQFGEIGLGQFECGRVADDKPFGQGAPASIQARSFADLFRLQGLGFLRRHRLIRIDPGDAVDEIGLGTFAVGEGRSIFTALAEMLGGVEPEPALLLARPVTGDTGVLEDRTDVALEIETLRRGCGRSAATRLRPARISGREIQTNRLPAFMGAGDGKPPL